MQPELPDSIHQRIKSLAGEGDALVEAGLPAAGISRFKEGLSLLPDPVFTWEAATWLLTAIGDTHFLAREYDEARTALSKAMLCPGALGNPFIWLRRGQTYFELGDIERAKDCLARAYMLEGMEIFEREDARYRQLVVDTLGLSSS